MTSPHRTASFSFGTENAIPSALPPLHQLPLEAVLLTHADQTGGDRSQRRGYRRVTVRNFPPILIPVWHQLARTMELISSVGLRQRLVTSHGLAILWHHPAVERIQRSRTLEGMEFGAAEMALRHLPHHYRSREPWFAFPGSRADLALNQDAQDQLSTLSYLTTLSASFVTCQAVIASFAASEEWVSREVRNLCGRETEHFTEWMGEVL